jgi:hypothetical protein
MEYWNTGILEYCLIYQIQYSGPDLPGFQFSDISIKYYDKKSMFYCELYVEPYDNQSDG